MKNKDKYDLNTLEIDWSPKTSEKRIFSIKNKRDKSIVFLKVMGRFETGSTAYSAWLESECKSFILNEKEKEYLSNVIKPFRNEVQFIRKTMSCGMSGDTYIFIDMGKRSIFFPHFNPKEMYKNMETGKEYSLEELEL